MRDSSHTSPIITKHLSGYAAYKEHFEGQGRVNHYCIRATSSQVIQTGSVFFEEQLVVFNRCWVLKYTVENTLMLLFLFQLIHHFLFPTTSLCIVLIKVHQSQVIKDSKIFICFEVRIMILKTVLSKPVSHYLLSYWHFWY